MSTLKVPSAQLYYEVSGNGPLLILIPGARGEGEVFRPLAHHLSAQYQVVTYDRRGFSRSSLDGPQDLQVFFQLPGQISWSRVGKELIISTYHVFAHPLPGEEGNKKVSGRVSVVST